jgi:hypothetical protein
MGTGRREREKDEVLLHRQRKRLGGAC